MSIKSIYMMNSMSGSLVKLLGSCVVASALMTGSIGAAPYQIIDLGVLQEGANFSSGFTINESSVIAGVGNGPLTVADTNPNDGQNAEVRAFSSHGALYDAGIPSPEDGQWVDLGVLPFDSTGFPQEALDALENGSIQPYSFAFDINDNGMVVGAATQVNETDASPFINTTEEPVLHDGTGWVKLGIPAASSSGRAIAVNNNGIVVGFSRLTENAAIERAWIYNQANEEPYSFVPMTLLSETRSSIAVDINDQGVLVGTTNNASNDNLFDRAFLYDMNADEEMSLLNTLGGDISIAAAINENGYIVGRSSIEDNTELHAFLYDPSQPETLIDLGILNERFPFSMALDINDSQQVVGFSLFDRRLGADIHHAFLYEKGELKDLDSMIDCGLGWTLAEARSINNKGEILGTGLINGEQHAYLLIPTPDAGPADQSCTPPANILDDNNEGGVFSTFVWLLFALLGVKVCQSHCRNSKE